MVHPALRALAAEPQLDPQERMLLKSQARILQRMLEVMGYEQTLRHIERAIVAVSTIREDVFGPKRQETHKPEEVSDDR